MRDESQSVTRSSQCGSYESLKCYAFVTTHTVVNIQGNVLLSNVYGYFINDYVFNFSTTCKYMLFVFNIRVNSSIIYLKMVIHK